MVQLFQTWWLSGVGRDFFGIGPTEALGKDWTPAIPSIEVSGTLRRFLDDCVSWRIDIKQQVEVEEESLAPGRHLLWKSRLISIPVACIHWKWRHRNFSANCAFNAIPGVPDRPFRRPPSPGVSGPSPRRVSSSHSFIWQQSMRLNDENTGFTFRPGTHPRGPETREPARG